MVSWATMNRPEVLNAVDGDRLLAWISAAVDDDEVAVLCLTGAGRAFTAGGDIKEMDGLDEAGFAANTPRYQAMARACRNAPKPVIAAINGVCLGAGMEFAAMSDLRIAAQSARLGLPDASLGFSVSGGLSWFLPHQIGLARTMELYLSERIFPTEEASAMGFVAEIVPDDDLQEHVQAFAERIAEFPPLGAANMKTLLYGDLGFDAQLDAEKTLESRCFADDEVKRRLSAFLESRRKR